MTNKKPTWSSSSSASTWSGGSSIGLSCLATSRKKKRARSDAVVVRARGSSVYRGVSRHCASGKYEVHLWDRHYRSTVQNRKGRQGAYETEEAAARTYDLAALKYSGAQCDGLLLNFPVDTYKQELDRMRCVTREEYVAILRRDSTGFTRGASKYRGVAKHHQKGRWEARIGGGGGKRYLYLGVFRVFSISLSLQVRSSISTYSGALKKRHSQSAATQEEAARAYDLAAIQLRGLAALTNFDVDSYRVDQQLQLPLCQIDTNPGPEPAGQLLLRKIDPKEAVPLLRDDVDDVDCAIAEILQALCMDRADFETRYPPRGAPGWWPSDDDVRELPADVGFEDDIESVLFDAPPAA
ncbi:hypothetical protein ZWY2020_052416 [Hordeum vulgare]|nr:hypothetical protein ZWY2020_052416 [Hordeum vulgare]